MKIVITAIAIIFAFQTFCNAQGIITTVAGNGIFGYSGDGGPATSAEFSGAAGVALDGAGNIYVADISYSLIRKISPSGIITTVAGNGTAGTTGDGGPATAAELDYPHYITADRNGNIYIADITNNIIRKVSTTGIISRFAGTGTLGYSGDGGPATLATLSGPACLTTDTSGNVYFADRNNNRVRKISTTGIISTIAGTGTPAFSGDGGAATSAGLANPTGVAMSRSGNLYIVDYTNNRIRKVSTTGIITTVAGNGTAGYSGDGGPATAAEIGSIYSVSVDGFDNAYITDSNRIRKINAAGIITGFAGNGTSGYSGDGGPATAAEMGALLDGLVANINGDVYIGDTPNQRVRKVAHLTTGISNTVSALLEATFPNPSNGIFCISTANNSSCFVEVYDLQARCVYTGLFTTPQITVDLSAQPEGTYLLHLNAGGRVSTQKIVVRH